MATVQITTGIIHLDSGQAVPFRAAATQAEVSIPADLNDRDEVELMTALVGCGFSSIVWRHSRPLPRGSVTPAFDFAKAGNPGLPARQPAMDPAVDRDLLERRSIEQRSDPSSPNRRGIRKGTSLTSYAGARSDRMKTRARPDMKTPFELDDNTRYLIFPDGLMTRLTQHEYAILSTLQKKKGKAVARETLTIAMYGHEGPDTQDSILTVVMLRVRKKLRSRAAIMTVWGFGYTLLYPGDAGYSEAQDTCPISPEEFSEILVAAE